MTIEAITLSGVIEPALAMLPAKMTSRDARIALLAIGLQESELTYRKQHGGGPARGLFQFERGGGVRGVLNFGGETTKLAHQVCLARQVDTTPAAVWAELEHDDILAAAFARLQLFTDPQPLPAAESPCWQLYLRTWRPGAFKRDPDGLRKKWTESYRRATVAVHNAEKVGG